MLGFTKSEKKLNSVSFSTYMDQIFEGIEKEYIEFGLALKKWKGLLISAIKKVSAISKTSVYDVFQEFMIALSRINSMNSIPLYRYDGKVYEIDRIDGFNVRLKTSRFNVRNVNVLWIRRERIEPVKKASLFSLIYNKIQQHASVMVRAIFTQKRGFSVKSTKYENTKVRNASCGVTHKVIKKNEVVQDCRTVSIEDLDNPNLVKYENIEDESKDSSFSQFSYVEMRSKIMKMISNDAQSVFKLLCKDYQISNKKLMKKLNFSENKVIVARREVLKAYLVLTKQEMKYSNDTRPYVKYNGVYYYLTKDEGDYVVLRINNKDQYIKKTEVIIYESVRRVPIHLPASCVA